MRAISLPADSTGFHGRSIANTLNCIIMNFLEQLRTFGTNRPYFSFTAAAAVGCLTLLTGCASPEYTYQHASFKFTVFHYKKPAQIASWNYDAARNDNAASAALNVATLITHGDVDQWMARWNESERPVLSGEEREALRTKWLGLKDAHLAILTTIVSGSTTVVEFRAETTSHEVQKLQVPLVHNGSEWDLTSVDPSSDFLNWEHSKNKIVTEMDSEFLLKYLGQGSKVAPQASL